MTAPNEQSPIPDVDKYSAVMKFVYAFGIPAAIAVYLIWFLVARIEGQQRQIYDSIQQHSIDGQYSVKSNTEQIERLDQIYRLMQRICVNLAKDPAERVSCFSVDRPQP